MFSEMNDPTRTGAGFDNWPFTEEPAGSDGGQQGPFHQGWLRASCVFSGREDKCDWRISPAE